MADLPFVDTHVHFHDLGHPRLRYEWLEPDAPEDPVTGPDGAIRARRYWADDFVAETRFHNVRKVVHVQAAIGTDDPVEETRWLQAFADRLGVPHGIVAHADLTRPDTAETLARHAEFPNLRGIRDLRYDGYLTDESWLRGYALLERHRLVCCDDPPLERFPDARRLAERFPGITLCIDHAGYPRRRDPEYFRRWRDAMRDIAAAPNVVVKISGLGQADHRWTTAGLRPWVLECIDAFGPGRAFFGSNWPVDRLYSSYGDVVDAYAEIISGFTEAERRALFSGSAERIFRLGTEEART
ncbi:MULTISPECIES: amidohydrolase family protein [Actinomadura]|uniref:Predicted metal-dependent hydrolase, TIM-barrel fold n=1 Tax=Actinomadura madurae TaxID=1993 RepID=A0A1I5PHJ0_9ACTN|nr:amidohydrolase family protein [Actinomadura madurae]SFP33592.1 Predicted metal-dependent hydrolase, TIM-barrel fold [Actinomadura madurae]